MFSLIQLLQPVTRSPRRVRRPAKAAQQDTFRPHVEGLEVRNLLSTFMVDHLADDLVGSGLNGSLRYCITNAADGDDIQFGVTGTIDLAGALPNLTHSIRIQGPGADQLTVWRNTGGNYSIFTVSSSATVIISGLTIGNGSAVDGGGIANGGTLTLDSTTVSGNSASDYGGGIYNYGGTLTLDSTTVSDNSASSYGVGIYNGGTMTVLNSIISGNSSSDGTLGIGGGIANGGMLIVTGSTISDNSAGAGYGGGLVNDGTATIVDSTLSNNHSTVYGGGVYNYYGTLTISHSTVSDNSAGDGTYGFGGGVYNGHTLTITDSTFSGNSATGGTLNGGGAIDNIAAGTLMLDSTTVSGNSVSGGFGGGVYNENGGLLHTRNTILAGNTGSTTADLAGDLGSLGHNLIGNTQGGSGFDATDLLNVDPLLGPLQDNGGPTWTMALLDGSPAIAAGTSDGAPPTDQRGLPHHDPPDIGAFEVQSAVASFAVSPDSGLVMAGVPFDLYVSALDAYGRVVTDYTGQVQFWTTDIFGEHPYQYTFQPSDQGVAYFPDGVTLFSPGRQGLYVFDTATRSLFGYAAYDVVSSAPSPGPGGPGDRALVAATLEASSPSAALSTPPAAATLALATAPNQVASPVPATMPVGADRRAAEVVAVDRLFASPHEAGSASIGFPARHQAPVGFDQWALDLPCGEALPLL